jgi:hypothetical protein
MQKYKGQHRLSFEITLAFPNLPEFQPAISLIGNAAHYCLSTETRSRYFLFFDAAESMQFVPVLKAVKLVGNYTLLINGKPRPFAEELWLPILDILSLERVRNTDD